MSKTTIHHVCKHPQAMRRKRDFFCAVTVNACYQQLKSTSTTSQPDLPCPTQDMEKILSLAAVPTARSVAPHRPPQMRYHTLESSDWRRLQGNHYCNRASDTGSTGYHYSNTWVHLATTSFGMLRFNRSPNPYFSDGSYYYNNTNGSTYYNSGTGYAQYTPPSGQQSKSNSK